METKTPAENIQNVLQSTHVNVQDLAKKIDETVKRSQARLQELQSEVADKTRYAAETADTFVHESPWRAVGYAAGIAFVLGLVIGRR